LGILEKAKNITDTDLRLVVTQASDPEAALRRHILSLEESQRQLRGSEEHLARQCDWLQAGIDRKLALAESWDKREAQAKAAGREDLAQHARERKNELLAQLAEDRRELDRVAPQVSEVRTRLEEVRAKIVKARDARKQLFGER
jgi:phage shock protein A